MLGSRWRAEIAEILSGIVFLAALTGALFVVDRNYEARRVFAFLGSVALAGILGWSVRATLFTLFRLPRPSRPGSSNLE